MAKKELSIDKICDMLIDGKTYRQIAEFYKVSLSVLHRFTSKPEHSVRAREALQISANSYADKGEQILLAAPANKDEIYRARELAQHYRWMAAKRAPKVYSDKIDVTTNGENINAPIIIDWSGQSNQTDSKAEGSETPS